MLNRGCYLKQLARGNLDVSVKYPTPKTQTQSRILFEWMKFYYGPFIKNNSDY